MEINQMKRPYVWVGADYLSTSAGIRACHRLLHELNERGYPAYTLNINNPDWNYRRITPNEFEAMRAVEPIVIYPEIVVGNPLAAKNVVRWVMNTPGYLGGDKEYDPDELVYTWSELYYDTDRLLTTPVIEKELFYKDPNIHKTLILGYVGKGPYRPINFGVTEYMFPQFTMMITPQKPSKREILAKWLREAKVLYTYDENTMLNFEAFLCGTKVILLPEGEKLTLKSKGMENHWADEELHSQRINKFIEETQAWAASR